MEKVIIRKSNIEDAKGIVEVTTYTWLTTYKGLLPDFVLDKRLKSIDKRIPKIEKEIREKDDIFVAVTNSNKVVGIVSCGKSRNKDYQDSGEIYAIYVIKEYQGLGLGKKLFMTAIKKLIQSGYNSMILNVLKGNNTIRFYEKYGGVKILEKSESLFGDCIITECIMYFDNLNNLIKDENYNI